MEPRLRRRPARQRHDVLVRPGEQLLRPQQRQHRAAARVRPRRLPDRIDYGTCSGELFTRPPAARRSSSTSPSGACPAARSPAPPTSSEAPRHWPDVPLDQFCNAGATCTDQLSPTFCHRKRLTKVTTQVLTPARQCAGAYCDVDPWTLTHQFPATGDGTSPALWLASISRPARCGGDAQPARDHLRPASQLPNRVDANEAAPPLVKWRIAGDRTTRPAASIARQLLRRRVHAGRPAGAPTATRCAASRSTWAPRGRDRGHSTGSTSTWSTAASRYDRIGGFAARWSTDYEYLDGPAWHYADNDPGQARAPHLGATGAATAGSGSATATGGHQTHAHEFRVLPRHGRRPPGRRLQAHRAGHRLRGQASWTTPTSSPASSGRRSSTTATAGPS